MDDQSRKKIERGPHALDPLIDSVDERNEAYKKLDELRIEIGIRQKSDPELSSFKSRNLVREHLRLSAKCMEALAVSMAGSRDGSNLFRISRLISELSDGHMPQWFEAARNTGGGKKLTRFERELISRALFFLEAVENRKIACRKPISRVAEAYDVSKQLVRNWRKNSDTILDGITPPNENCVEESMLSNGQKYRSIGRGGLKLFDINLRHIRQP